MNAKWANRFLDLAGVVANWSKDPSTKVGAVLTSGRSVLGLGYNGFPPGCLDDEVIYNDRPRKYLRVIHAEMNALVNSFGKTPGEEICLFSTLCPCSSCAAVMIRFGVHRVYCPEPTRDEIVRWGASFEETKEMFKEAGVGLIYLPR